MTYISQISEPAGFEKIKHGENSCDIESLTVNSCRTKIPDSDDSDWMIKFKG